MESQSILHISYTKHLNRKKQTKKQQQKVKSQNICFACENKENWAKLNLSLIQQQTNVTQSVSQMKKMVNMDSILGLSRKRAIGGRTLNA